jgi:hypothetical protein
VPAGTSILTYKNLAGTFEYNDPSSVSSSVRTATLFSADHGIWGRSTIPGGYSGDWTVMVDIVNWYKATSYPPVPALLQGESPYFFPYNHLGPYSANGFPIISNTPLTGEASTVFELDLRGYIQGTILGMNWDDGTRTMSWVNLEIIDSSSYQYYWYTWDGWFDGYLNPGAYQVTVREWADGEGHVPIRFALNVSAGRQATGLSFILANSQVPIPEFAAIPLSIITVSMAAGLVQFNRRRRQ